MLTFTIPQGNSMGFSLTKGIIQFEAKAIELHTFDTTGSINIVTENNL